MQSRKLADVCYDIRGPVLEEAKRLEDEGRRIIKLNIGNPAPFGFDAPEEILLDVIRQPARRAGLLGLARPDVGPHRRRAALPEPGHRHHRRRRRLARQRGQRADLDGAAGDARQRRRGARCRRRTIRSGRRRHHSPVDGRCTICATRPTNGCPTSTISPRRSRRAPRRSSSSIRTTRPGRYTPDGYLERIARPGPPARPGRFWPTRSTTRSSTTTRCTTRSPRSRRTSSR